jgi:hypothetical protein
VSPATTGAWFGAALGFSSFAILRWAAARTEGERPDARKRKSAALIRAAALTDLLLFPVIGYVVGPMVLDT